MTDLVFLVWSFVFPSQLGFYADLCLHVLLDTHTHQVATLQIKSAPGHLLGHCGQS